MQLRFPFSLVAGRCWAIGLVAAAHLAMAQPVSPPPLLPVETFFSNPEMSGLRFSPDGRRVLALVPYAGRRNLVAIDLDKGTKNLLSSFKDRDVLSPFWANDGRILFSVDDDGKEEYSLYAVNPDGSNPTNLNVGTSVAILRSLPEEPRSILVQAAITHRDWWDVAFLDLRNARLSKPIAKAPGNVDFYVLDWKNVVRLAVLRDWTAGLNRVLYRESDDSEWREISAYGFDEAGWEPISFDGDNRTVFVWSTIGRRTRAIHRYDTQTGRLDPEPVAADDTHDISGVIYDPSKNRVVGVAWMGDRQRFLWLDEELKAIHARLSEALPDTVHTPVQFARDGSKIIFFSASDRDPGVYYLYDRKSQRLSEIAVVQPGVDPEQMARMRPITFKARDGLVLHGYLTLPVGREPRGLPLIVNPHGGPYGVRDEWGFNPEVQFYANRGYAVLQINFRGSGGYGGPFEAAGFKKWGLEMQDDITDGVRWAIAEGVADPKRIVISGASYGGYVVMTGLVTTPELYRAGINYVGVVDIKNLIPKAVPASRMHWMNTRLGDLSKAEDRQRIHDTSPVNFADRIRAPVLMAYGRNDPRVPVVQAYDIQRALKRSNVPHELIIEDDEGHGFRQEDRRIEFYRQIDAFLREHVPVDPR